VTQSDQPDPDVLLIDAPKVRPTLGRIVLYTLDEQDAQQVQHARLASTTAGANTAAAGSTFPAIVVKAWEDPDELNLQVFLDGPDTLWVTSIPLGTGPRSWAWPPRA